MSSPQQKTETNINTQEEQPNTYPQLLNKSKCVCAGGALIRPSGSLPSGTNDIGDILTDINSHLTNFTSAYSMILAILKMIACIIEVLCAIPNPFAIIAAMIRLFGTCLPEFILIFPFFTIPAIILCYIKIFISIIEFIITNILKIILDIINNINKLRNAILKANADSVATIAFKLAALIKELYNIIGILVALGALYEMLKALLKLGIGIPCGGSDGEEDANCPTELQQGNVTGTDGTLLVILESEYEFKINFLSPSKSDTIKVFKDFFPEGIDYSNITIDNAPYSLLIDGTTYAIMSIDSSGICGLFPVQNEQKNDGYLSNIAAATTLADPYVRFATHTNFFNNSYVGKYLEIFDLRGTIANTGPLANNGTWKIEQVYDAYNVKLTRDPLTDSWDEYGIANPNSHILWRLTPNIPTAGFNKTFELSINYEELMRHNMIGVGCHPAVAATKNSLRNRFGGVDLSEPLADLPDFNSLINDLYAQLATIGPEDVTADYILDNYDQIEAAANVVGPEIESLLNSHKDDLVSYAITLCPRVFDAENSTITVSRDIELIGKDIEIIVIPINRSGFIMAADFPPNTFEVTIQVSSGTLSQVTEILDEDGETTGQFSATLRSNIPGAIDITASVCNNIISDFDGSTLSTRIVRVEYMIPEEARRRGYDIKEPLGKVGK